MSDPLSDQSKAILTKLREEMDLKEHPPLTSEELVKIREALAMWDSWGVVSRLVFRFIVGLAALLTAIFTIVNLIPWGKR